MARVLALLPATDFDPTEIAVPWQAVTAAGHTVVVATPDGSPGQADPRMLTGEGLGVWASILRADANGRAAYAALSAAPEFRSPARWADVRGDAYDALLLAGGHAPGMRVYLESALVQAHTAAFFVSGRPVAAICHGTLVAARTLDPATGRSVLHGRRTTGLLRTQELLAWAMTAAWLGNYYRTYTTPLQVEVTAALAAPDDFVPGPVPLRRDAPGDLAAGFVHVDGNYLSARWPGDAHRFGAALVERLRARIG